jgi:hypothetical protein
MQKYLLVIVTILSLSSCKKWLDVKPETQVTEQELFTTEAGFQEALNGIYIRCSQTDMYGGALTYSFTDVLAQNYTIEVDRGLTAFYQTSLYNYKDPFFMSVRDNSWRGLYNAIVNCNLILENLDKHKEVLSAYNYTLIKGEALGLRAYLHFDALRLFGPSFASKPNEKAIPYVTTYSNKTTVLSTVTEALNSMVTDLTNAKALLKATDSITSPGYKVGYPDDKKGQTENAAQSLFLQNRRFRMNYYAVCGTLARAYLYMNKKAEALSNATEVITANKFPWTLAADFINASPELVDRVLYPELVFSWFDSKGSVNLLTDYFVKGSSGFMIELNAGKALYETGGVGAEDLRFKQWMKPVNELNNERYELQKYLREKEKNRHPLLAPALRLSELYYIAAECSWDTDPAKALGYLNKVRNQRSINSALNTASKEEFITELIKEARKEWYAEGQIFFMYKRLNRNIVGQSGNLIPASDKIFVLPLPDDEIEYGQR